MNRNELLDNLDESMRRDETVTLTLRPLAGVRGTQTRTGQILAVGEHYTSRASWQVVLARYRRPPLIIGLSMITNFRVGR